MDESQRLRELFDRYLRRSLPPAEVEEMLSLLERAGAEDILSVRMRQVWEELKSRNEEYTVNWDRMLQEVTQADLELPDRKPGEAGRRPFKRGLLGRGGDKWREIWAWRSVAAMFVALAGLAAYWSVTYRGPTEKAAAKAQAGRAGPAAAMASVSATQGDTVLSRQTANNKKVVHLPDGSMVILNKRSRVEYRNRELFLTGEAYFDIIHRAEQPFLVHTGKLVTRVLGTAFNIRAYPTDRSIEVTVDHGKVQVLEGGANLGLLSDKEQIRVLRGTERFQLRPVDLKPVIAWKPEEISFDDISMLEATRRIGQRFGMSFVFANPALKRCHITATFYMEDDLDQIMEVVCGVNQSTYAIQGKTVRLDGKGCN